MIIAAIVSSSGYITCLLIKKKDIQTLRVAKYHFYDFYCHSLCTHCRKFTGLIKKIKW